MASTTGQPAHAGTNHQPSAAPGRTILRIGCVKYLNTLPLVEGLASSREIQLIPAAPADLAPMLHAGQVDIALASVIDAARPAPADAPGLTLLPVGGIGCDGPTLTVRLFSAVPLDRVRTLAIDTDSHTSAVLCQVLLARAHGVRPVVHSFTDSPGRAEWPETVLVIGDKVVTHAPPADRYPHQLDLGEAWKAWTGLPFVYACWMCRTPDAWRGDILAAADLLERARLRNTARLDWLVSRYADQRGWPADLARNYVSQLLRYDIGPAQREAVARFFAEAATLGLIPPGPAGAAPSPRWLDGAPLN